MHLVLINQFYPPDAAPTGRMVHAVAQELGASGHQVTILTSDAGYAADPAGSGESDDPSPGVRVLRVKAPPPGRRGAAAKLLSYAAFYTAVATRVVSMKPRPTRVVALTTPPFLALLARAGSRIRGADHAHWVMDLYPDVMTAHGMVREGGVLHRVLLSLSRLGFGGSRGAACLTLGPDMAERLRAHLPRPREASWIPLWPTTSPGTEDDGGDARRLRRQRGWGESERVVMYSGNMGLGHRFGEFLALAARRAEPGQTRFVFYGDGRRRGEIESFVAARRELPIELHDYAPLEQLGAHLRSADLHLVSLEPAWTGTMVPSKLQGIFHVGRPVLFVGSRDSSIARWVDESGGGWVVPPDDLEAGFQALDEATPEERRRRGHRAREFAREHFSPTRNPAAVARILTQPLAAAAVTKGDSRPKNHPEN